MFVCVSDNYVVDRLLMKYAHSTDTNNESPVKYVTMLCSDWTGRSHDFTYPHDVSDVIIIVWCPLINTTTTITKVSNGRITILKADIL